MLKILGMKKNKKKTNNKDKSQSTLFFQSLKKKINKNNIIPTFIEHPIADQEVQIMQFNQRRI